MRKETYDDLDREKRPLGNASGAAFGHGGARGLTAVALAAAVCAGTHVTAFAYDEESKLTGVTDALGGEHSFVYDRVRNLVAKQDARGSLTTHRCYSLNLRRGEYQHLDQADRD